MSVLFKFGFKAWLVPDERSKKGMFALSSRNLKKQRFTRAEQTGYRFAPEIKKGRWKMLWQEYEQKQGREEEREREILYRSKRRIRRSEWTEEHCAEQKTTASSSGKNANE